MKRLDLEVLIVDDEKRLRSTLRICLQALRCRVDEAPNAAAARAAQERQTYDLALVDLRLGTDRGLDLVPSLLARSPRLEVVIMTAFATIETAVEAIRLGAQGYLPKPFTPEQIQQIVERVALQRRLHDESCELRTRLGKLSPELDLGTDSPRMRQLLDLAERVAAHEGPVLLRGETGTGKAVLARRLHALSSRAAGPFVIAATAGRSEELLARELFGQGESAFLDEGGRPGLIEAAEGGSLYLDEIGELSPRLQARLVRMLDERRFERIGETEPRRAQTRLIAASSHDLPREVQAGRFRADLFARLKALELSVPPLRERREDILRLARRFVAFFSSPGPIKSPELTLEAETALVGHDWPGNLRELSEAMERAAILRVGTRIGLEALPERIASHKGRLPYLGGEFTLEAIEREHILRVLANAPTQEEASRVLGIDASTLWRKRKRYEP